MLVDVDLVVAVAVRGAVVPAVAEAAAAPAFVLRVAAVCCQGVGSVSGMGRQKMAACRRAGFRSPCFEPQKPRGLGLELLLSVLPVPVVAVPVEVVVSAVVLVVAVLVGAVLVVVALVVVVLVATALVVVLVVAIRAGVPLVVAPLFVAVPVVVVLVGVALGVAVLVVKVLVVRVLVGMVLVWVVLLVGAAVVGPLVGAVLVGAAPVAVVVPEVVHVRIAPLCPVVSVAPGSTMKLGPTRAQLVSARMAIRPGSPPPFSEEVGFSTYQEGQAGFVRIEVGRIDLVLPSLIVHPLRASLTVASWSYESAVDPTGTVALVEDSCDSVLLSVDCALGGAGFVGSVAPAAADSGAAGHQSLGNGRVSLGCSEVSAAVAVAVAVADPIVAATSLLALAVGSLVSAHPAPKGVAEVSPAEAEAIVAARYVG